MKQIRYMAFVAPATLLMLVQHIVVSCPANAGTEPTMLDERYYSSGRAERHQRTSPTLPAGSPIPDSPSTIPTSASPTSVAPTSSTQSSEVPAATTQASATPSSDSSSDAKQDIAMAPVKKVDAAFQLRLDAEIRNDTSRFRMRLQVSDCSPDLISRLKDLKRLRIVTTNLKTKEIIIEAPAALVSELVQFPEIRFIDRNSH